MTCALHGCSNVTGGAVELSWDLETGGLPIQNTSGACLHDSASGLDRIANIRLWWKVDATTASHDFPCRHNHDVTSFEVPPGQALLWVEPQCADGTAALPKDYIAPAPIARTITVGDVVELHAVVVELDAACACTSPRPSACM